jgi:hypothetical protein
MILVTVDPRKPYCTVQYMNKIHEKMLIPDNSSAVSFHCLFLPAFFFLIDALLLVSDSCRSCFHGNILLLRCYLRRLLGSSTFPSQQLCVSEKLTDVSWCQVEPACLHQIRIFQALHLLAKDKLHPDIQTRVSCYTSTIVIQVPYCRSSTNSDGSPSCRSKMVSASDCQKYILHALLHLALP